MKKKKPSWGPLTRLEITYADGRRSVVLMREIVAICYSGGSAKILLYSGGHVDLGEAPTRDLMELWNQYLVKSRRGPKREVSKIIWKAGQ